MPLPLLMPLVSRSLWLSRCFQCQSLKAHEKLWDLYSVKPLEGQCFATPGTQITLHGNCSAIFQLKLRARMDAECTFPSMAGFHVSCMMSPRMIWNCSLAAEDPQHSPGWKIFVSKALMSSFQ